ncbi:MAG: ABC transporter permease [Clostridiales bacterium]|nr:ABC transporter permease [Clostridiales bacterium]
MKTIAFANRNLKEILRDLTALLFVVGMPLLMLLIWLIISQATPGDYMPANFQLVSYIPGVALFGMTFLSMFLGIHIAQDKSTSFLSRLFAGPMKTGEYLLGYALPVLPLCIVQMTMVLGCGLLLGYEATFVQLLSTMGCLLVSVPAFIAMGLFLGSLLSEKAVAPLSSILVQLMALTSGMMLDVDMIGGVYGGICKALPFYHALNLAKVPMGANAFSGWISALVVLGYTVALFMLSVVVFRKVRRK